MDTKNPLIPTGRKLLSASLFFWLVFTVATIIFTVSATLFSIANLSVLWTVVISLLLASLFILVTYYYKFPLLHSKEIAKKPVTKKIYTAKKESALAFSYTNKRGVTYFLHARNTTTKTGKTQTLYFFSKEKKAGVKWVVPPGYKVSETVNGLPVLKKA